MLARMQQYTIGYGLSQISRRSMRLLNVKIFGKFLCDQAIPWDSKPQSWASTVVHASPELGRDRDNVITTGIKRANRRGK